MLSGRSYEGKMASKGVEATFWGRLMWRFGPGNSQVVVERERNLENEKRRRESDELLWW
jgi:hypothetical protein